jgi:hypothetical protein
MDKLKITFKLVSPIITNGGYMTLDALLAALIFSLHHKGCFFPILDLS